MAVALFLYGRAARAVRGARRAVACRAACARLVPRQGALLLILRHYRDASSCAALYHALMRTASCPRRVFVAVYQELGPGDLDVTHLVHRAEPATDRLRVVTVEAAVVGPAPLGRAVQQVLAQALRGERTTVLLVPGTVPGDGRVHILYKVVEVTVTHTNRSSSGDVIKCQWLAQTDQEGGWGNVFQAYATSVHLHR